MDNSISIVQGGNGNFTSIGQNGTFDGYFVQRFGDSNRSEGTQSGIFNDIFVAQIDGYGNVSNAIQAGARDFATLNMDDDLGTSEVT